MMFAVLAGLSVGTVPVEGVGVADALAEVPDGAAGSLFVEQADAILTGAVETAHSAAEAIKPLFGNPARFKHHDTVPPRVFAGRRL